MATFAPSRAALRPIASPMPRDAPVMNSVLPERVDAIGAIPIAPGSDLWRGKTPDARPVGFRPQSPATQPPQTLPGVPPRLSATCSAANWARPKGPEPAPRLGGTLAEPAARHAARVGFRAQGHNAIARPALRAHPDPCIVCAQARIDRPVDKRRASHPLPQAAFKLASFLRQPRLAQALQ